MKNKDRKQVLITGGSSGIGLELAKKFAEDGYEILLSASNEKKLLTVKQDLEKHYQIPVSIYAVNLAKQGAAKQLYDKIKNEGHEIEILVNNAGIGTIGAAEKIPLEEDEALMILNMMTPVSLTKLFLKEMYQRHSGKILNVCSVGAYQPGPYTASYYASKSFLLNYTKAVRYEAKSYGVSVCALCPGTTDTGFFKRAGSKTPKGAMSAKQVAAYAYKRLQDNKEESIPGAAYRFMQLCPVKLKTAAIAALKRPRQ